MTMDYELIDHGIDHAQYFQGCGTAFTEFDHVVTGCGSNFAEALDECLEMIAQDHDSYIVQELERELLADKVDFKCSKPEADEYHYEENYYVSIRYNMPKF